jgi:hypothetical protein
MGQDRVILTGDHFDVQDLCRNMAIDVSKIRFSWDISPPSSGSRMEESVPFNF